MASIVTTDAWVTLHEVMAYCQAGPEAQRDFEYLLNEATDRAQNYMERKILTRSYANEVYDGTGEPALLLRQWPVTTLTKVEFLTGFSATSETWTEYHPATDTAYIEGDHKQAVYFRSLVFPRGRKNVRVTYTAGYSKDGAGSIPKLPQELKQAVKQLVLSWFKKPDQLTQGIRSVTFADQTYTYDLSELPETVRSVFDRYRRVSA